ncbi:hypothetical protein [Marinobacter sp. LN3S78]|uniref:hypothetical protein n=1 Tax=Marinobacter sp. LN3S78 TaxID=3382300 RepID=UPI00387ACC6B
MAVHPSQVTWSPEAAASLAAARATPADLEAYRRDVERDLAHLWRVPGEPVSYVLTRVEQDSAGSLEMVIVAGAGQNAPDTIEWFTDLARRNGIPSIRAHINRPGLTRIFERQGYTLDEWIMRARTDGQ